MSETFPCCQNCAVDIMCQEPCEKFSIENITVNMKWFDSMARCKRLMNKYENLKLNLDKDTFICISSFQIEFHKEPYYLHREDGPAVIHNSGEKQWWVKTHCKKVEFDDGTIETY